MIACDERVVVFWTATPASFLVVMNVRWRLEDKVDWAVRLRLIDIARSEVLVSNRGKQRGASVTCTIRP